MNSAYGIIRVSNRHLSDSHLTKLTNDKTGYMVSPDPRNVTNVQKKHVYTLFIVRKNKFGFDSVEEINSMRMLSDANWMVAARRSGRHVSFLRVNRHKKNKVQTCPSRQGWGHTVWPRSPRRTHWNKLKSDRLHHRGLAYSEVTPSSGRLRPHVRRFRVTSRWNPLLPLKTVGINSS